MRGAVGPDLYGLPGLDPQEKETVRIGTLLAIRSAEASDLMWLMQWPFWIENPPRREGSPSFFSISVFRKLVEKDGVGFGYLVQCELGAATTKPTELLHFAIDFSRLPKECTHPKRWWARPWDGAQHFGSHPPLRGKQWYVPLGNLASGNVEMVRALWSIHLPGCGGIVSTDEPASG